MVSVRAAMLASVVLLVGATLSGTSAEDSWSEMVQDDTGGQKSSDTPSYEANKEGGDDKKEGGDDKKDEGDDKKDDGDDKKDEGDDKNEGGDDKKEEGDDKKDEGDDKTEGGDDKKEGGGDKNGGGGGVKKGFSDLEASTPSTGGGGSKPSTGGGGKVPDGTWPKSTGTVQLKAPQVIKAGEDFDGKMQTFERSDVTCNGQKESGSDTAVFLVEAGATLRNVIIGKNQMEGVHCDEHDCVIDNVWWDDVCEDALTIKGGTASSVTTVTGGGARLADDKVIQHNSVGTIKIDGFYGEDIGKLYRSCGTCGDKMRKVEVSNVYVVDLQNAIVTVNKNYKDEATLGNIWVTSTKDKTRICQWSEGSDGGEPKMLGDGPSPPLCQYSESDVHINKGAPSGGSSKPSEGSSPSASSGGDSVEQEAGVVSPGGGDDGQKGVENEGADEGSNVVDQSETDGKNEGDDKEGGDDKKEGGDDDKEGGDDKKEGGDDKKDEGDDKKEEGDDKKDKGDDKKDKGDDKKDKGDDKNEGGDDKKEGGGDKEGGDDKKEGGVDKKEGGDDKKEGGDDKKEGGDDKNGGGGGVKKGFSDLEASTPSTGGGGSKPSTGGGGKVPDGTWPKSTGTVQLKAPQVIKAGEDFDGKMQTFERSDVTCNGQKESGSDTAVFLVEAGATLRNVIIGKNQMEGVHCDEHDCVIDNVWWDDVCEDALTIKGGTASSVTTVTGGGARLADDKVIQHNSVGTIKIDGFYGEDIGKLYRSCGTCGDKMRKVEVSNVYVVDLQNAIVTVNKNYKDEATLGNIWVTSTKDKTRICQWSEGSDGGEPKMLGDGPSPPLCQYSESDVHINKGAPSGGSSKPSEGSSPSASSGGDSVEQEAGVVSPGGGDDGQKGVENEGADEGSNVVDQSETDGKNEGDDKEGGDDKKEGGDDDKEGGDDKKEGGDDKKDEGDDKKDKGDDKKDEGDDKKEEGDDKKDKGDDKNEGGDDKKEGGGDKEGGDDKKEGGVDKKEGGDDKKEGGDDKKEGGDDKNGGGGGVKKGFSDLEASTPSTGGGGSKPSTGGGGKVPDGTWPKSTGTVQLKAPQVIKAGEDFDGKMQTFERSDVTCNGQKESGSDTAVFLVEAGATLRNVIIGKNQMEGVHCDEHDCVIDNVWWDDVCEDALTIKGGTASSVTTVTGGGARLADDKVIQHNSVGTIKIDGFYGEDIGKLYRSCGTCGDKMRKVEVSNVYVVDLQNAIVTVNKNYKDEATLGNIWVTSTKDKTRICQWSEGSDGGEPKMLGDGPSPPLCQYSESNVHINKGAPSGGSSKPSEGSSPSASSGGDSVEQEAGVVSPGGGDDGQKGVENEGADEGGNVVDQSETDGKNEGDDKEGGDDKKEGGDDDKEGGDDKKEGGDDKKDEGDDKKDKGDDKKDEGDDKKEEGDDKKDKGDDKKDEEDKKESEEEVAGEASNLAVTGGGFSLEGETDSITKGSPPASASKFNVRRRRK